MIAELLNHIDHVIDVMLGVALYFVIASIIRVLFLKDPSHRFKRGKRRTRQDLI